MNLSEAIKIRIINLCNEQNITLHQLSLKAGITYSTLSSFLNNRCKNPKISPLLHLCEGLNIDLKTFFDDKIFENIIDEKKKK